MLVIFSYFTVNKDFQPAEFVIHLQAFHISTLYITIFDIGNRYSNYTVIYDWRESNNCTANYANQLPSYSTE